MELYNDEFKIQLGMMIEAMRVEKEVHDRNWCKTNFIEINEEKPICTWRAYKQMTTGIPLKDDAIYDLLILKLGYDYENSNHVIVFIDQLFIQLEEYVEYCNETKILEISEDSLLYLRSNLHIFMVEDYIECISILTKFYCHDSILNIADIKLMNRLLQLSTSSTQSIILDILSQTMLFSYQNLSELNEFFETHFLKLSKKSYLMVSYNEYLFINKRVEEAITSNNKLLDEFIENGNMSQEILLRAKLYICCNDYINESHKIFFEWLFIHANNGMSKRLLCLIHYRLGNYFYNRQLYKEAYSNFEKLYKENVNKYYKCYIYCYDISNRMNNGARLNIYINGRLESYDSHFSYYRYFQLKVKEDDKKVLMEYIIKEIRPTINEESLYYPIFLSELISLISSAKEYKYLYYWHSFNRKDVKIKMTE